MAVILVTYDLKQPGRNYQPVWDYLKKYAYCKGLESVWLLDTSKSVLTIRDELSKLVDSNDVVLVAQMTTSWASWHYNCAEWLKSSARSW